MTDFRLIFRVAPEIHEDIVGYLTRVANQNHLGGLDAILTEVLGVKQAALFIEDLPALAYYCRLNLEEMVHLSGIARRMPEGVRAWQICDQWITKAPFIATRRAKVCSLCLREAPYVRGMWSLSFYTTCVRHSVELIDRCPGCRKALKWNRRSIQYCSCGFDLARASPQAASGHGTMVAELLELQCGQDVVIHPYTGIGLGEHENLAKLSLDGLCKTIWFLGHCLGELGKYGSGHGRFKPMPSDADAIIVNALNILGDWPSRFGERLAACKERTPSKGSAALIEKLLGPVHNYLEQELQDSEFTFVRAAYEQHIHNIWRAFGKEHRRWNHDRQFEFDFGS